MASIVYMRAWQAHDENASFNALCSITKKYSKFDAVSPGQALLCISKKNRNFAGFIQCIMKNGTSPSPSKGGDVA